MNDLSFRDQIDGDTDFHRDDPPVDRDTQNPQKARPKVRRRWGAGLFAVGAIVVWLMFAELYKPASGQTSPLSRLARSKREFARTPNKPRPTRRRA